MTVIDFMRAKSVVVEIYNKVSLPITTMSKIVDFIRNTNDLSTKLDEQYDKIKDQFNGCADDYKNEEGKSLGDCLNEFYTTSIDLEPVFTIDELKDVSINGKSYLYLEPLIIK